MKSELELIGNLAHDEIADESAVELAEEVHNLKELNTTTAGEKAHLETQLEEVNEKLRVMEEELSELQTEKAAAAAAALLIASKKSDHDSKDGHSDSESDKSSDKGALGAGVLVGALAADAVIDELRDDDKSGRSD